MSRTSELKGPAPRAACRVHEEFLGRLFFLLAGVNLHPPLPPIRNQRAGGFPTRSRKLRAAASLPGNSAHVLFQSSGWAMCRWVCVQTTWDPPDVDVSYSVTSLHLSLLALNKNRPCLIQSRPASKQLHSVSGPTVDFHGQFVSDGSGILLVFGPCLLKVRTCQLLVSGSLGCKRGSGCMQVGLTEEIPGFLHGLEN